MYFCFIFFKSWTKGVVSSKICHIHLAYWWINGVVPDSASQKHLSTWWISVVVSNSATQKHLSTWWISVVVGGQESRKQLSMMVSDTEQLPPPPELGNKKWVTSYCLYFHNINIYIWLTYLNVNTRKNKCYHYHVIVTSSLRSWLPFNVKPLSSRLSCLSSQPILTEG